MAQRKEVFQSKVLQKLYPAAPKLEREPSPPSIVDALANKTFLKRKSSQEDAAGKSQSAASKRIYTVLPPPADYKMHSEQSFKILHIEDINSAKDPAEESCCENEKELNQDKEEEQQKGKRRRRKRKSTLHQDSGKDDAAPLNGSSSSQSQRPVDEGGEHISRNKKRKLKKKRHKEKLLSLGLMPRASALEFTYQKDGEVEKKQEDNEGRAAEVSDFLRTTLEIYMSDPSVHGDKLPLLSATVDGLLSCLSSGCPPIFILKQLYSLKVFVQQKETEKLKTALNELYTNSFMSAEETAAVDSLFQYWITDILPIQRDKTTRLSATHTQDCHTETEMLLKS